MSVKTHPLVVDEQAGAALLDAKVAAGSPKGERMLFVVCTHARTGELLTYEVRCSADGARAKAVQ